jgi:zinc transporter 1/2/3
MATPRTLVPILPPVAALLLLLVAASSIPILAAAQPADACGGAPDQAAADGACHDVPRALRLKLIAIPTILVSSVVGVCLPLLSRSVPALRPDGGLFAVVKAFASGVILATGYMHVLPDAFNNLTSPCLPRKPWSEFPFAAFVAMLAAVSTLMADSLMLTYYNRSKPRPSSGGDVAAVADHGESPDQGHRHGHGHGHGHGMAVAKPDDVEATQVQLRRNRVVVQVTCLMRCSSLAKL